MTILNIFQPSSKPKQIVTSKPIFQFSSSFIDSDHDDIDLEKQTTREPTHTHFGSRPRQGDVERAVPEQSSSPLTTARSSLILHILNTILSLVSLSLFVTAIPLWNANFEHTRSLVSGDYTDGLTIAPLILSLFSSIYILLACHARLAPRLGATAKTGGQSCTIKPTTQILIALTIILTLAPALTISATNSLALAWKSAKPAKSGLVLCNLANIFARECQPTLYVIGGLQISGIVLGGVIWLMWAWFFVVAVRRWVRERRARNERRQERRRRRQNRRVRDGETHTHDDASRARRAEREGSKKKTSGQRSHAHQRDPEHTSHHSKSKSARALHPPLRPGESSAARLASSSVKPKETIQAWLADRYA